MNNQINLTHINNNTYTTYIYLKDIDNNFFFLDKVFKFERNGEKSKLYKEEEIYCRTRMGDSYKIYNYETNDYEDLKIPDEIKKQLKKYKIGDLVYNNIIK